MKMKSNLYNQVFVMQVLKHILTTGRCVYFGRLIQRPVDT